MSFFDNKLAIPFVIILILFGSVTFGLTLVLVEDKEQISTSKMIEQEIDDVEEEEIEFIKDTTDNTIPLKEAKLNIEHNAQNEDTGFY